MPKDGIFMNAEKSAINVFQKYLTVWVLLCMVAGVLTEVPVMLFLVHMANKTRGRFPD